MPSLHDIVHGFCGLDKKKTVTVVDDGLSCCGGSCVSHAFDRQLGSAGTALARPLEENWSMGHRRLCLAASLTLVLGSAGTPLADPVGIGSAAAARDRVEGVLDGAASRFINTGSEVYSTA